MSTSGQADPEMQPKSRFREDCNPKRDVVMRDFSTALPIGRSMHNMSTQSLATSYAPPLFRGFPYLVSRIVAGLHHIIPLPLSDAFEFPRLREIARIQTRLNQLPTCLVLSSEACLFIWPDGREIPSCEIPNAPHVEFGKLLASEVFPETDDLVYRQEMLQRFTAQLHIHQGGGQYFVLGDLSKGGRSLRPEEEDSLQGVRADGVPNGLSRCSKYRELRGDASIR
jgi:hypothetical protein